MKSFDDFLDSSDEKTVELIVNAVREEFPGQETVSVTELTARMLAISKNITLETLRVYHDWLSEQIQE